MKKTKSGKINLFNKFETKVLQLGRYHSGTYTEDYIKSIYMHNLNMTFRILPEVFSSGIKVFRLSSNLFPLFDIVDKNCWDNDDIKTTLKKIGHFISMHQMRISVHPGQFCVLSSDSDRVVDNAVTELAMHAWFFDQMGLDESPFYAINIHGGKADRTSQLIERIESLPSNIRSRLTLENDENCYSLADLVPVHERTGTSLVFDSHHHVFNEGGLSMSDAHNLACATWTGGIKPLQHISNTSPDVMDGSFTERRKHSDMIHYVPEPQLAALRDDTIDVDVEAKHKNLSVFQMSKDFQIPL